MTMFTYAAILFFQPRTQTAGRTIGHAANPSRQWVLALEIGGFDTVVSRACASAAGSNPNGPGALLNTTRPPRPIRYRRSGQPGYALSVPLAMPSRTARM